MSEERPPTRTRPKWALVWAGLSATSALACALVVPALLTTRETLANDPCAGSWDNRYAVAAQIVLLVGVVGAVIVLGAALVKRDRPGAVTSVLAVAVSIILLFIGTLVSSAGYGWRCPEF